MHKPVALGLLLCCAFQVAACNKESDAPPMPSAAPAATTAPTPTPTAAPSATVAEPLAAPSASGSAEADEHGDRHKHFEGHEMRKGEHEHHP